MGAVLNMANQYTPGGGWKTGAGAQEENLHRRTNLCDHLSNFRNILPRPMVMYPLPEFGGVFSPNVCVFRGSEQAGYPFLREPRLLSILTAAAYCNPACSQGRLMRRAAEGTRKKIVMMLRAAKCHH